MDILGRHHSTHYIFSKGLKIGQCNYSTPSPTTVGLFLIVLPCLWEKSPCKFHFMMQMEPCGSPASGDPSPGRGQGGGKGPCFTGILGDGQA